MKPLPFPLRVAAGLAMTAAEHARELPKSLVGLPVTVASQLLQFTMRLQQQVTELAIKGDEVLSALRPVEEAPSWATFDEDLPPVESTPVGTNGHSRATAVRDVADRGRDPWEDEERALAENHIEGEFDSGSSVTADNAGREVRDLAEAADEVAAAAEVTTAAEIAAAAGVTETAAPSETAGRNETAEPRETAGRNETAAPSETRETAGADEKTAAAKDSAGPASEPGYDDLTLPQLRARLRRFTLGELEELLDYERAHENRPSFVGMLARRIGNVQRTGEGDGRSGA